MPDSDSQVWKDALVECVAKRKNLEDQFAELRESRANLLQQIIDLGHERNGLEEQLETAQHENAVLREFWSAHWGVEQAVADFDLHAEAVERLRAAQEAAYRLVSNPAKSPLNLSDELGGF